MRVKNPSRTIPSRLRTYIGSNLRPDLLAGLTSAMVVVPQSMALAAIANLNPIYGIYTAIIPAIIGSLFGSSNHMATGPTNAAAMVTFSVLVSYANKPDYPEYVFAISVLCGVFILVLGLLRLGGIVRYVSNSVLTGFLAGATVLIVVGQLGNLFGVNIAKDLNPLASIIEAARQAGSIRWEVLATAAVSMLVMVFFPKLTRVIPAALVTVVVASLFVMATGWHSAGVKLVADLNLPPDPGVAFHIPQVPLSELPNLLSGAGAISLLIVVEAIAIAKSIGMSSGQRINPSREFIGQGLASLAGGFFQCFPAAGSLSRSAVNFTAGARTRIAGVSSGFFVWIVLLLFSQWISYIPVPSLAAVVVVSALGLVDGKHIRLTWKTSKYGRLLMIFTALATLMINLETAIYLGVVFSILIYLYETGKLDITYLVKQPDGGFVERSLKELYTTKPEMAVINVQGNFYFAAVDDLEHELDRVVDAGVRVIILRVRDMKNLGSTGVTMLQGLVRTVARHNRHLLLSGVAEDVMTQLRHSGILATLGEDRVYAGEVTLFESTNRALEAGATLLRKD